MNSSRGSRLAMWRVRGAAALGLGALLLAAACGSNASVEVGPRPVRLYDALDGATLEGPGAAQRSSAFPARELQSAELASWRALAWQGLPVDLTAAAPGASRELDALKLGPETSAWLGIVEAPPGASLAFEAGIQGAGLGGVGDSAKLGIIEFVERPGPEQLTNFAKHMVAAHFGDPVQLDSGGTAQLLVRTDESTRYLVLLLLLGNESQNPELGVTFHDLTLRPATEQDRLRAILGTRDEDLGERAQPAARLAPFQVAMTQRRALLLASDERLELPLGGVSAGDELDLSLGIVPQLVDPLKAPLGAVLSFSIGLVDAAGSEHPLGSLTLEATSATQERWHALRLPLPTASQVPAGWRAPLRLVVRATSPLERNEAPLGLVAEPRLVPAALKSSAPRRAERRPNIIVISIDTLRADRMSLFGNPRPTTPAIDALARRSLVFERAWSNGAYTLPSHMSLFTGQVPSLHGVQDATTKRDPVRSPLLAEQLAARGYTTVAFTGGGFVDPGFGFGAGFDSYGTLDPMVNTESVRLARDLAKIPGVDRALLEASDMGLVETWLEEHRREEFLLFLHTYATHQFDPPQRSLDQVGLGETLAGGLAAFPGALELLFTMGEGGHPEDFEDLRGLYDATVRQSDEGVGRLLAKLEELDLLEDSLIVLTSDHGKELGEHGAVGHGHALFEEMVHVPLVLFLGDRARLERGDFAPGRSASPASLVDAVPTILEALDLAPGPALSGLSLLHPLPDREVLAEVQNLAVKFAVRRGNAKTIWSPLGLDTFIENTVEEVTFDLARDPLEQSPLEPDAARIQHVRAVFEAIEARSRELGGPAGADAAIDKDLRARLEALGYVEDMRRAGD